MHHGWLLNEMKKVHSGCTNTGVSDRQKLNLPRSKMGENEGERTADIAGDSTTLQVSSASMTDRLMEPESHGAAHRQLMSSAFLEK